MDQETFVDELAKLRPSATFLSLVGYCNEHNEVANYNIVFHIDYNSALEKSINFLKEYKTSSKLEEKVRKELIKSYSASLKKNKKSNPDNNNSYQEVLDNEGNVIKGIKLHVPTSTYHLYGFLNSKHVVKEGSYPVRNKLELTIAKDKLRKLVPVSKFRQFRINPKQLEKVNVEKLSFNLSV